jgi:hypothetical protein
MIYTWHSKFGTFMILLHNYAGNSQKSPKTMIMKMFVTLDKAKPYAGNIKRLKLGGSQTYNRSGV